MHFKNILCILKYRSSQLNNESRRYKINVLFKEFIR